MNIQGLSKNIEQFKMYLYEKNPIAAILSETHITVDIEESEINVNGYRAMRCDSHSRHTGGVIIYVQNSIKCDVIVNKNFNNEVWILSVRVLCQRTNVIISGLYKSPISKNNMFLSWFRTLCESELDFSKINIIAGDFNINIMKDTYYKKALLNDISYLGLKQIVKNPTRITDTSRTLIDLVLTNQFQIKTKVNTTEQISDHSIIHISLDNVCYLSRQNTEKHRVISYNIEDMINSIKVDSSCFDVANINEKSELLTNEILNSVNKFTKYVCSETRSTNIWYNKELLQLKKKRDKAFTKACLSNSADCWATYKMMRNQYSGQLNASYNDHVKNQLISRQGDQKGMWKILKTIVSTPKNRNISDIKFNEKYIAVTNKDISEQFNKYFIDSIVEINLSIDDERFEEYYNINYEGGVFEFKELNLSELFIILNVMKRKKDLSGVSTKLIIDLWPKIGKYLLKIINSSLSSGEFPNVWKESVIVPVVKIEGSKRCEDFRPINTMPTLEKILETVVKVQLLQHIEKNNLFITEQSGYRKNHSCETALNYVIADWKVESDRRKFVLCVFIDLRRAFETVDRALLIEKLSVIGIKNKELKWFTDYLYNRKQRTKCNEYVSSPLVNDLGVPQGSVLGAILFLLYINNMKCVFNNCKFRLFADDTIVYISGTDIEELSEKMNDDLNRLLKFLNYYKLKLNSKKSKYMIISTKKCNSQNIIKIGGDVLERVEEMKYLGCIIDEKLNFNGNCDYVCKKMAKKINFFSRIANKLNRNTRVIVYNTILAPHINYCSTILFLSNQTQVERVQKLQNRAMRIILSQKRDTNIQVMLNKLEWMSVRQKLVADVLTFVYKTINNLQPEYLSACFQTNENCYVTRQTNLLKLPLYKKSATQRSLMYEGAKIYNDIPNNIKQCNSLSIFKNLIRIYVKEQF